MDKIKKIFIPLKGDSTKEIVKKCLTMLALLVLIACIVIFAIAITGSLRTERLQQDLSDLHKGVETVKIVTTVPTTTTAPPTTEATDTTTAKPPLVVLDSMKPLLEENPDTAGWISVAGGVDGVVVQAADNEKYLHADFYGKWAEAGTIFADFRDVLNDYNENQSSNIIIYGHNQRDGTMFGKLKEYKITHANTTNFSFYKENPTFTFSNLYEEYTYKIIAMFVIEVEPSQTRDGVIFNYHNFYEFFKEPPYTFADWESGIMSRTAVNTGVEFDETDKFITLSTCSNEFEPSRFVLIGRRVRPGESPEVDTSLAELNTDAIEPDWKFIYG
ncbi:MAG: class B sortase [Ruminococcus sp.]|jgi:sortase B|nr:class B sortase [Ruminococcus sp.]